LNILYLDVNAQYLNPTAALLPQLFLSRFPSMKFFGPGYLDKETISAGVARWVDANGPYDIVILGPNTPFLGSLTDDALQKNVEFVMKYMVTPGFSARLVEKFFRDVLVAVSRLPIRHKVVSGLSLDSYASTQEQVDKILEAGAFLLGPNHQFSRRIEEWPNDIFLREKHYQKKKERLTDAWHDFLVANPDRVITACHYVLPHEFSMAVLAERRWDVAIPGAEYVLRRDAIVSLEASNLGVAPKKYFHFFRLANRLGLPVYRHYLLVRLYNHLFQRTLATSRMVYTSSGGSGNVPRKYFEIPAAGAALVCTPCNGFGDLGFRDYVNCIVADPANLASVVARMRHDQSLQGIADAGRQLVMRHHSIYARSEQIARCLRAIISGTYAGSRWECGEFCILETT
jgi:hypothetical protein